MFKRQTTDTQPTTERTSIVNAMTIDVEDYFQVGAFKGIIDKNNWDSYECRIEANTDLILDLLSKNEIKGTFFTLGWIADRYPDVIRKIVAAGHELASHGYGHQMITDLSQEAFREDVIRAKKSLEDIGGKAVFGYRAPSFSIGKETLWAHDLLQETGHIYSSSIYPIKHDLYGMPDAPRFAHRRSNGLLELPATSIRINGINLPASGGGFFRLLPLWVSRKIIAEVNKKDHEAAIFYCHPWEFDPAQPRVRNASIKSKFRHYINLRHNATKYDQLLRSFRWAPIREVFSDLIERQEALKS
jgi:polysaccharide deacetylase family protein (PEP-CTERM system associated)